MTRKEWMQIHYPDKVGRIHAGGVVNWIRGFLNYQTIALDYVGNVGTPKFLIPKRRQK